MADAAHPPPQRPVEAMVQEALGTLSEPLRLEAHNLLPLPARETAAFFICFRWRGRDGFRARCLRPQGSQEPHVGCWCQTCFMQYTGQWSDLDVVHSRVVDRMILFHNSIPYRGIDLNSRVRYWTMRLPFLVMSLTVHVRRWEDDHIYLRTGSSVGNHRFIGFFSFVFTPLFADIAEFNLPPDGGFVRSRFYHENPDEWIHDFFVYQAPSDANDSDAHYADANQHDAENPDANNPDANNPDANNPDGEYSNSDDSAPPGNVLAVGDNLSLGSNLAASDLTASNAAIASDNPLSAAGNPTLPDLASFSGDSILPDPPDLNVTAAPRNLAVAGVLAVNDDRGVGANPNNSSPVQLVPDNPNNSSPVQVVPDLDLQKSPKRPRIA